MTDFTYEDCRRLDDEYETPERSPLHRSNRFPERYAQERANEPA